MKIFLDDERDPFPWMQREGGWVVARNPYQFYKLLGGNTKHVEAISFDNDLGSAWEEQGYDLLNYVEELVRVYDQPLPVLMIHTANLSAMKKMHQAVHSLRKFDHDRKEKKALE